VQFFKKLTLLIFCYLTPFGAFAYEQVNNLLLEQLSVEQGLSQSSVTNILQDDEGFIWISTNNGLNVYDGYNFRTLPGPIGNFDNVGFYKLLQDSEGLLWINSDKGLYTYNKKNRSL